MPPQQVETRKIRFHHPIVIIHWGGNFLKIWLKILQAIFYSIIFLLFEWRHCLLRALAEPLQLFLCKMAGRRIMLIQLMNILFSRADYFQSETLNHKSYENYNDDQELKQYCILWWSSNLALGFHVSKKNIGKTSWIWCLYWRNSNLQFYF